MHLETCLVSLDTHPLADKQWKQWKSSQINTRSHHKKKRKKHNRQINKKPSNKITFLSFHSKQPFAKSVIFNHFQVELFPGLMKAEDDPLPPFTSVTCSWWHQFVPIIYLASVLFEGSKEPTLSWTKPNQARLERNIWEEYEEEM